MSEYSQIKVADQMRNYCKDCLDWLDAIPYVPGSFPDDTCSDRSLNLYLIFQVGMLNKTKECYHADDH